MRALLLSVVVLAIVATAAALAVVQPISLHGRLVATEEDAGNCVFHLDTVTITAPEQAVCDYLTGSIGYKLTVTIAPDDPR